MDRERIYDAIRKADAAGDAESVRRLGQYLQEMDAAPAAQPAPQASPPAEPQITPQAATIPPLEDRAKEAFGLEDLQTRGTILPLGRTKDGNLELAMPQIGVDMMQSAMLPGHAMQGGQYDAKDVAKFALDYGAPATSRAGMATKPTVPTKKQWVANQPTPEALGKKSGALYTQAENMGVTVNPRSYDNLLSSMARKVADEGFDEDLNPQVASVFKAIGKRQGQDLSVQDLEIVRKQVRTAIESQEPSTKRLGVIMQDMVDDYVEKLGPNDVLTGDATDVAPTLAKARDLWKRRRKVETIENFIEDANMQASGFENGMRIVARRAIKANRKRPVFSDDEIKVFKEIEAGSTGQKLNRLLAKLSFVRSDAGNLMGGSIGAGGGAAIGGAIGGPIGAGIGAMALPAAGYVGQKAGIKSMTNQANMLRAMAAYGKGVPKQPIENSVILDLIARGFGPTIGAMSGDGDKNGPNGEGDQRYLDAKRKAILSDQMHYAKGGA